VAERLDGSRCRLAKILEDLKFSLEIWGPKAALVLLCKFSLYWAVHAPIGARPGPEASASPASWMIGLWGHELFGFTTRSQSVRVIEEAALRLNFSHRFILSHKTYNSRQHS